MVLIVVGVVLVCVSAGLGLMAYTVHSTFGSDGRLNMPLGVVDAGTAQAVVIDIDRFSAVVPYLNALGNSRLTVSAAESVFVGIAGTQDADGLIRGTTYVVATRQDNAWATTTVPGIAGPISPQSMGAQHVWLEAAQGSDVDVVVPQSRPITMVVVGAGPLKSVTVGAVFDLPHESTYVTAGTVAAGCLALIGITLIVVGWVLRSRRGEHEVSVSTVSPNEG